jgi:hypothetical protein
MEPFDLALTLGFRDHSDLQLGMPRTACGRTSRFVPLDVDASGREDSGDVLPHFEERVGRNLSSKMNRNADLGLAGRCGYREREGAGDGEFQHRTSFPAGVPGRR